MPNFFVKLRASFVESPGRFPVLLLCAAVCAGAAAWALHHKSVPATVHFCQRLILAAAIGVPLCFSLRVLAERSLPRAKGWLEWLALPLLAVYFRTLPAGGFSEPTGRLLQWALLLGALHFLAAIAAFMASNEEGFWQFNRRVFQSFCTAALYTSVLLAGLELALFSADKLFELRLDKAYPDLFFFITGCVHPIFFLKSVPRDFEFLTKDEEYPRGFKAFTQLALAPLVAVFTLILYAYGAKIALNQSWPHGWVSLPVLVLSGVGILAFLLLHPLRNRKNEKWAYWFCRLFPSALAPLAVLLLLALRERITAYGITEERYLGAVAGGCILLWALVTSFKKDLGLRWWPSVLGGVCILCAFGPWSAVSVSLRSQLGRVALFMEKHGLLAGGTVTPPEKNLRLPQAEFSSFQSTLRYVLEHHGKEPLENLFSKELLPAEPDRNHNSPWEMTGRIITKLNLSGGSNASAMQEYFNIDAKTPLPISGYKSASLAGEIHNGTNGVQVGGIWFTLKDGVISASLQKQGDLFPIPLQSFFSSLPMTSAGALPFSQMSTDWDFDGQQYRIVFTNLQVTRVPDAPPKINRCTLLFLAK